MSSDPHIAEAVVAERKAALMRADGFGPGATIDPLTYRLLAEIARQDEKHGPFEGTVLGRSRLAIACLEDEVQEVREAWRKERKAATWDETRSEVLQVAAVAIRALRDAL